MATTEAATHHSSQRRRDRTITTLTDEQLSHKRNLDRKAQRALRQRTKSRIQDLETELAELKARAGEQDESLKQELATLRDRNRLLESRLQHIMRLASDANCSIRGEQSSVSAHTQSPSRDISDCITVNTHKATERTANDSEDLDDGEDIPLDSDPESEPLNGDTNIAMADQGQLSNDIHGLPNHHLLRPTVSSNSGDHSSDSYLSPVGHSSIREGGLRTTDFRSSVQSHHSGAPSNSTHAVAAVRDFYLDGSQLGVPSESSGISLHSPESSTRGNPASHFQSSNQMNTVSSVLCPHLPATCPLDRILLDFLTSRRALASSGTPTEALIGPDRALMTAMLFPEAAARAHPVSRVMVEVLRTFYHVKLPEKLAFMYLMHATMRWQILPNKENYDSLPRWLRPTATQITTPHAAWIDNIPWPRIRDMLIEHADEYPFEKFSEMYSHNVSVNWTYDDMDAVRHETDENSGEIVLNNIFEKHIQRLTNWTVAPDFEKVYPEMSQALKYQN